MWWPKGISWSCFPNWSPAGGHQLIPHLCFEELYYERSLSHTLGWRPFGLDDWPVSSLLIRPGVLWEHGTSWSITCSVWTAWGRLSARILLSRNRSKVFTYTLLLTSECMFGIWKPVCPSLHSICVSKLFQTSIPMTLFKFISGYLIYIFHRIYHLSWWLQ